MRIVVRLLVGAMLLLAWGLLVGSQLSRAQEGTGGQTLEIEGGGGLIWVYTCQARTPADLSPFITQYFPQNSGVTTHTINNRIIFRIAAEDAESKRAQIARYLALLDTPRPQVMLVIKVRSYTYDNTFQLGSEMSYDTSTWENNPNIFFRGFEMSFHPEDFLKALAANPPTNSSQAQINQSTESANNDFSGSSRIRFTSQEFDTLNLGAMEFQIRSVARSSSVENLANTILLAEAGFPAKFEAGSEVPVQSSTVSGSNTVVATEFRPVGVVLRLTPTHIGADTVELDVEAEISTVSQYFDPGDQSLSNPVISQRTLKTIVNLSSGETLQLGGLLGTRSFVYRTGIPVLMEIPVLGYAFRSTNREQRRQDIDFRITPYIVGSDRSYPSVADLGFSLRQSRQ